jgi:hypothetical protein
MTYFVEGLSDHVSPSATVRRIGSFQTVQEAIAAAKHAVDEFLVLNHVPGMQAAQLFQRYRDRGEYPFIFQDNERTVNVGGFSHIQYATTRAEEICKSSKPR